jgi:hypothetical protein
LQFQESNSITEVTLDFLTHFTGDAEKGKKMELKFHLCIISLLLLSSSKSTTAADSSSSSSSSEIISRFQRYLQINTAQPEPQYQEAADFILSEANSLSLDSQTLEFVPGKPLILLKWPGSDPSLPSILLNSHTDVVPAEHDKWAHPPFSAHIDPHGKIYARGSQDMKCVGMQYLEAIRRLKASGFKPTRTVYLSFVPDEEIGGHDGAEKFAESDIFKALNVGIVLDEGQLLLLVLEVTLLVLLVIVIGSLFANDYKNSTELVYDGLYYLVNFGVLENRVGLCYMLMILLLG